MFLLAGKKTHCIFVLNTLAEKIYSFRLSRPDYTELTLERWALERPPQSADVSLLADLKAIMFISDVRFSVCMRGMGAKIPDVSIT